MKHKEVINFIEKGGLTYRGRAMAFYEDGRDYGVVTVMSTKESHYIVTSHRCFIYSEANHELVGNTSTGGHTNVKLFEVKLAPCGRKYVLTCDEKHGHTIYIGNFF